MNRGRLCCLAFLMVLPLPEDKVRAEETVLVYAAASLSNAVEALVDSFGRRNGIEIVCSFAGSSTLARQIERGAPADLYLSANELWMDYLEERSLIQPGTRTRLTGNRLVWAAPLRSRLKIQPVPDFDIGKVFQGRLALADPDHVPGGLYAKEALKHLGWWQKLRNRLAVATNVRTALVYVEKGACELGIVYRTDVHASSGVQIAGEIPDSLHSRIVYSAAAVRTSSSESARLFLNFLVSEEAGRTFEGFGFMPR